MSEPTKTSAITTPGDGAPTSMHTPGPWRRGSDNPRSPEIWTEVYSDDGFLIATANTERAAAKDRAAENSRTRANAYLMAASPDMYSLLQQLQADGELSLVDLRRVLAKAEGRTP